MRKFTQLLLTAHCSLLTVAVLALFVVTARPAQGQCPFGNCPGADTSWIAGLTITGVQAPISCGVGNNCRLNIYWKYRTACGNCDVYIDSIVFANPAFCTLCSNFGDLLKEALEALLRTQHPGPGCEPEEGKCVDNWRAMVGGCWRAIWAGGSPPPPGQNGVIMGYEPCPTSACCYQRYRVCRDNNNVRTADTIGAPEGIGACDGETCFQSCGNFPPYVAPAAKMAITPRLVQEAIVTPNPTFGTTTFTCASDNASEATLVIHDMRGVTLLQQQGRTGNDGIFRFTVDVRELPSGTYGYSISSGDGAISAGSFTVTK